VRESNPACEARDSHQGEQALRPPCAEKPQPQETRESRERATHQTRFSASWESPAVASDPCVTTSASARGAGHEEADEDPPHNKPMSRRHSSSERVYASRSIRACSSPVARAVDCGGESSMAVKSCETPHDACEERCSSSSRCYRARPKWTCRAGTPCATSRTRSRCVRCGFRGMVAQRKQLGREKELLHVRLRKLRMTTTVTRLQACMLRHCARGSQWTRQRRRCESLRGADRRPGTRHATC
jgi:hypothetical protein